MARLSVNALTTFRWSLEEDLHYARSHGYDGVGLWLRKVNEFGEERAIDLVAESGLRVSCVSWGGGFTGADAASAEDNLVAAENAIEFAGAVGADCLTLYSGGRNGHTSRHADRLLRGALDRLLPVAEAVGVPLALEPLHPGCAADWTILTSLPEALHLVRQYDTHALRLAFDTYHFPLGPEAGSLLKELAPYLAVVHLGGLDEPHGIDHARAPLGASHDMVGGIVRKLVASGYRGFFDVKLLGPAFDSMDYHQVLRDSRRDFAEFEIDDALASTKTAPPLRANACKATW